MGCDVEVIKVVGKLIIEPIAGTIIVVGFFWMMVRLFR